MRKYVLIAAGGFWGAILRFFIKTVDLSASRTGFPINTLIINILGSFALGFFITIAERVLKLQEEEKLGVIAGFLGAFTTFSTISKEISLQLASGSILTAVMYAAASVVLGLLSIFAGVRLGRHVTMLREEKD